MPQIATLDIEDLCTEAELVTFLPLPSALTAGNDVTVRYTCGRGLQVTSHDWVGVFSTDLRHDSQPLAFQWAKFSKINKNNKSKVNRGIKAVTFPADSFNAIKDDNDVMLRFAYISRSGKVMGSSSKFKVPNSQSTRQQKRKQNQVSHVMFKPPSPAPSSPSSSWEMTGDNDVIAVSSDLSSDIVVLSQSPSQSSDFVLTQDPNSTDVIGDNMTSSPVAVSCTDNDDVTNDVQNEDTDVSPPTPPVRQKAKKRRKVKTSPPPHRKAGTQVLVTSPPLSTSRAEGLVVDLTSPVLARHAKTSPLQQLKLCNDRPRDSAAVAESEIVFDECASKPKPWLIVEIPSCESRHDDCVTSSSHNDEIQLQREPLKNCGNNHKKKKTKNTQQGRQEDLRKICPIAVKRRLSASEPPRKQDSGIQRNNVCIGFTTCTRENLTDSPDTEEDAPLSKSTEQTVSVCKTIEPKPPSKILSHKAKRKNKQKTKRQLKSVAGDASDTEFDSENAIGRKDETKAKANLQTISSNDWTIKWKQTPQRLDKAVTEIPDGADSSAHSERQSSATTSRSEGLTSPTRAALLDTSLRGFPFLPGQRSASAEVSPVWAARAKVTEEKVIEQSCDVTLTPVDALPRDVMVPRDVADIMASLPPANTASDGLSLVEWQRALVPQLEKGALPYFKAKYKAKRAQRRVDLPRHQHKVALTSSLLYHILNGQVTVRQMKKSSPSGHDVTSDVTQERDATETTSGEEDVVLDDVNITQQGKAAPKHSGIQESNAAENIAATQDVKAVPGFSPLADEERLNQQLKVFKRLHARREVARRRRRISLARDAKRQVMTEQRADAVTLTGFDFSNAAPIAAVRACPKGRLFNTPTLTADIEQPATDGPRRRKMATGDVMALTTQPEVNPAVNLFTSPGADTTTSASHTCDVIHTNTHDITLRFRTRMTQSHLKHIGRTKYVSRSSQSLRVKGQLLALTSDVRDKRRTMASMEAKISTLKLALDTQTKKTNRLREKNAKLKRKYREAFAEDTTSSTEARPTDVTSPSPPHVTSSREALAAMGVAMWRDGLDLWGQPDSKRSRLDNDVNRDVCRQNDVSKPDTSTDAGTAVFSLPRDVPSVSSSACHSLEDSGCFHKTSNGALDLRTTRKGAKSPDIRHSASHPVHKANGQYTSNIMYPNGTSHRYTSSIMYPAGHIIHSSVEAPSNHTSEIRPSEGTDPSGHDDVRRSNDSQIVQTPHSLCHMVDSTRARLSPTSDAFLTSKSFHLDSRLYQQKQTPEDDEAALPQKPGNHGFCSEFAQSRQFTQDNLCFSPQQTTYSIHEPNYTLQESTYTPHYPRYTSYTVQQPRLVRHVDGVFPGVESSHLCSQHMQHLDTAPVFYHRTPHLVTSEGFIHVPQGEFLREACPPCRYTNPGGVSPRIGQVATPHCGCCPCTCNISVSESRPIKAHQASQRFI